MSLYDVYDMVSSDIARSYIEEQQESRKTGSGMWGAIKARSSRAHAFSLMGSAEDRLPGDMVVRVDGIEVVIPAACMTKTGSIRKDKATQAEIAKRTRLAQEWACYVSRSDVALAMGGVR